MQIILISSSSNTFILSTLVSSVFVAIQRNVTYLYQSVRCMSHI